MPRNPVTDPDEPEETAGVVADAGADDDFEYDDEDDTSEVAAATAGVSVNGDGSQHFTPPIEPLTSLELILDEKYEAGDAWGYIDEIETRETPLSHREPLLDRWVAMVAERSMSERDMLIARGRRCWSGVTLETIRTRINDLVQQDVVQVRIATSIQCADFFACMVRRPAPETPSIKYAVYKFTDGTVEYQDSVVVNDIRYEPPQWTLLGANSSVVPVLPSEVPTAIPTAELRERLATFIKKYFQTDDEGMIKTMIAYVFATWAVDKFGTVPYFHVQGDFGSAKTRCVTAVGVLCYLPLFIAGNITPAVIYRLLDRLAGTLIIDEADPKRGEWWDEILTVLNHGNQRGFDVVKNERPDIGGKWEPSAFKVFGFKMLGTRKMFHDEALASRCITFSLPVVKEIRTGMDYQLPPDHPFWTEAAELQNHLLRWRIDNLSQLVLDTKMKIDGLMPRMIALGQSLITVIRHIEGGAIGKWEGSIIAALLRLSRKSQAERADSWEGQVAAAFVRVWDMRREKKSREVAVDIIGVTTGQQPDASRDAAEKQKFSKRLATTLRGFRLTVEQKGHPKKLWVELPKKDEAAIIKHLVETYSIERQEAE